MHVRHPIWLKRVGKPGIQAFAILFAIESLARATMATVLPLEALELLGDAQRVSTLFFVVGVASVLGALSVPLLVRLTARRWVYSAAAVVLLLSSALIALDGLTSLVFGMVFRVLGVVGLTICINLYIMDYIARHDFGHVEPLRIFYSAASWTLGPFLGVYLRQEFGTWAPCLLSAGCVAVMLIYFWRLRFTDNPSLARPLLPVASPQANLRRFFAQPRLVMAWLISVTRNFWWVIYFVYVPIYAVESGLGELVGGLLVSLGTAFSFLLLIFGRWARQVGVRRVLLFGFSGCGIATLVASSVMNLPWIAAACLLIAALCLIVVDAVGNTPFMLAVKPRERAEMTTVYSTYRDVAELAPPGLFAILLKVFPLPVVFVVAGGTVLAMALLSRRVHPRLGLFRKPAPQTLA